RDRANRTKRIASEKKRKKFDTESAVTVSERERGKFLVEAGFSRTRDARGASSILQRRHRYVSGTRGRCRRRRGGRGRAAHAPAHLRHGQHHALAVRPVAPVAHLVPSGRARDGSSTERRPLDDPPVQDRHCGPTPAPLHPPYSVPQCRTLGRHRHRRHLEACDSADAR
uniref:Uncharacterized protein n=1 Tax=Anopheles atroparvus TaxID=41427 RepID=A0AAG5DQ92_ANOAO